MHPLAILQLANIHREELALYLRSHVRELLHGWMLPRVIVLIPIRVAGDQLALEVEESILDGQRHPALRVGAQRFEVDELPEDQATDKITAKLPEALDHTQSRCLCSRSPG